MADQRVGHRDRGYLQREPRILEKIGRFYVDSEKVFHLDNLLDGQVWAFDTAPRAAAHVASDEKASAFIALRDDAFALYDAALKRRAQYRQSLGQ